MANDKKELDGRKHTGDGVVIGDGLGSVVVSESL